MTRKAAALLLFGAALAALAAPAAFAQCAMCKTALTNSSEGQRIATNLNHAILLMFFAPYLVFSVFVATIFRGRIRRWLRDHVPAFVRTAPKPALPLAP
jgi:hypothetical protein